MGCWPSKIDESVVPPVANDGVPLGAPTKTAFATTELCSGEINIEVLLPPIVIPCVDERSKTNGQSPSPTGVSQRSKKSVTFNPISTIKEYRRDSSSADKNFTTYIISQLGEDNWSDDESDGVNDGDSDGASDHHHDDSPELALYAQEVREYDDYNNEDWRADLNLSEERALEAGDPGYIQDFDFDYQEHEYGVAGEDQGMYARLSGAHSYRPESCVWVCSN